MHLIKGVRFQDLRHNPKIVEEEKKAGYPVKKVS